MANPITKYIQDRFIQPAVNAGVEKALRGQFPSAYGTSSISETSLAQSIGQPHEVNFVLLYSIYKLNADVSGSVHKWQANHPTVAGNSH